MTPGSGVINGFYFSKKISHFRKINAKVKSSKVVLHLFFWTWTSITTDIGCKFLKNFAGKTTLRFQTETHISLPIEAC